jgi:hypothetical protein
MTMNIKIKYCFILGFLGGVNQPVLSDSPPNTSLNDPIIKTSLSSSVNKLALSVNNPKLNPALTGNIRTITIQNIGNEDAYGLSIHYPNWPNGTTAKSDCGDILKSSETCTISIKPGAVASAQCDKGTLATPSTVTVSAQNALAIRANVIILNYGCVYEGGYVFSIDDQYSNYHKNMSVGGKVVQTDNEAYSMAWDSSIGCITEPYDKCTITHADNIENGAYYLPAAPQVDVNGNSYRIVNTLPINLLDYAAGLCRQNIAGYSDWYLPAICEWGYYTPNSLTDPGCGPNTAPHMQNILSNLVDNGNIGNLWGMYWSSTENSNSPNLYAWFQYVVHGGYSFQSGSEKSSQMNVRCVRALTT